VLLDAIEGVVAHVPQHDAVGDAMVFTSHDLGDQDAV
jgi:hypothetical protein